VTGRGAFATWTQQARRAAAETPRRIASAVAGEPAQAQASPVPSTVSLAARTDAQMHGDPDLTRSATLLH